MNDEQVTDEFGPKISFLTVDPLAERYTFLCASKIYVLKKNMAGGWSALDRQEKILFGYAGGTPSQGTISVKSNSRRYVGIYDREESGAYIIKDDESPQGINCHPLDKLVEKAFGLE
ncbi:hypothetical protein HN587_03300 [Candidatus Woesearchaeota archaeon]|jgi:hypothetical protein|nr:hypothetical protein [Candidatus Woesearchaeota archaeon]